MIGSTFGQDTASTKNTLTVGELNARDLGKTIAIQHPEWGLITGTIASISHYPRMGSLINLDKPEAKLTLEHNVEFWYAETQTGEKVSR